MALAPTLGLNEVSLREASGKWTTINLHLMAFYHQNSWMLWHLTSRSSLVRNHCGTRSIEMSQAGRLRTNGEVFSDFVGLLRCVDRDDGALSLDHPDSDSVLEKPELLEALADFQRSLMPGRVFE